MADAFVIEHHGLTAGIAVRERGGFRFYTSDALFLEIDTRKFRRLREVSHAVRRIADAVRESASGRRHARHLLPVMDNWAVSP